MIIEQISIAEDDKGWGPARPLRRNDMMASRRAEYAEESAEVEVLYANLEKLKALTRKIQATNDRVETSGKTINDHLAPVYSSTQKPYTTINNINKINEAINRMRKPLDSKMREEEIIRAGQVDDYGGRKDWKC